MRGTQSIRAIAAAGLAVLAAATPAKAMVNDKADALRLLGRLATLRGASENEKKAYATLKVDVEKGYLQVERISPNNLTLVKPGWTAPDQHHTDQTNAVRWYRAMSIDEYGQMTDHNPMPCTGTHGEDENDFMGAYCGIAPQMEYSWGFCSNKKPCVLEEYTTHGAAWLYSKFTGDLHCQAKAEGGGTFGLGPAGQWNSCLRVIRSAKGNNNKGEAWTTVKENYGITKDNNWTFGSMFIDWILHGQIRHESVRAYVSLEPLK